MLDPLTALSVASSVVQFVDFGSKLLSKSIEISKSASGELGENRSIKDICLDLKGFCERLAVYADPSTTKGAAAAIVDIGKKCRLQATSLIMALSKLEKKPGQGKAWAVRLAFQSLWKKDEIESILKNLGELRSSLILNFVLFISEEQSTFSKNFWKQSEENSLIRENVLDQLHDIKESIEDIKRLQVVIAENSSNPGLDEKALADSSLVMDDMLDHGEDMMRQRLVVKSLQFPSMRKRESDIVEAHQNTFEWIFNDYPDFSEWLFRSAGIFWVSGKPGSGKSTLMKFISSHPLTDAFLHNWAGERILVTASFYFWHAGTIMQKSLQGLFQSLIFEICRKQPSIIPEICPSRWEETLKQEDLSPWTWKDLENTFDLLISKSDLPIKFCFFIDGLDEFEGDHSDLVNLIFKVAKSSNFKLCVSSRPWNVFDDAYSQFEDRMLKLQDLTKNDIRLYVKDKLETHKNFLRLKQVDPRYGDFVQEIADRADGVFLWVFLVVRSLREGITNADTITTLQKRLRELPMDLRRFFSFILRGVEGIYREGTTQTFQMALASPYPLPLTVYSVLDEELDLSPLKVGSKEQQRFDFLKDYAATEPLDLWILERRLNARCKGLLEARQTMEQDGSPGIKTVEFLHRTVRDFLQDGGTETTLQSRLQTPFDADLAICIGMLPLLRNVHVHLQEYSENLLDDIAFHASQIEARTKVSPIEILDQCASLLGVPFFSSGISIFTYVARHNLSLYLDHCAKKNPGSVKRASGVSLLVPALLIDIPIDRRHLQRYECHVDPKVVKLLLQNGANPNERFEYHKLELSIWKAFLVNVKELSDAKGEVSFEQFQIICLMLENGASTDVGLLDQLMSNNWFSKDKLQQLKTLICKLDESKKIDKAMESVKKKAKESDDSGLEERSGEDMQQEAMKIEQG